MLHLAPVLRVPLLSVLQPVFHEHFDVVNLASNLILHPDLVTLDLLLGQGFDHLVLVRLQRGQLPLHVFLDILEFAVEQAVSDVDYLVTGDLGVNAFPVRSYVLPLPSR